MAPEAHRGTVHYLAGDHTAVSDGILSSGALCGQLSSVCVILFLWLVPVGKGRGTLGLTLAFIS